MALITKLNNIANAIGQKTGEPASTYTLDNMPTAISNIQTAFPVVPDPDGTKTVRFIDYDGTIVTQMTVDEAAELTSLPELPTHEGLTAEGWNYTLAEVTSTTNSLDVGAIYQNSANARQSLFEMYPTEGQSITLNIGQSVSGGVVIDWGDGSATETVSGEGNVSATHTYSSVATGNMPFKLTLTPSEGTVLTLGHGGSGRGLFNNGSSGWSTVKKAILGEAAISNYAFNGCSSLASVSIPSSATSIGEGVFGNCYALASVSIPSSVTGIGNSAFNGCSSLASISIPNSVAYTGSYAFQNCFALASVAIPSSFASIGYSAFASCPSIASFSIPSSVLSISNYAFQGCHALASVAIPSSVTSIASNAFQNCYTLASVIYEDRATMPSASNAYFFTSYGPQTIDCSSFTQVPTVSSNFFSYMPAYVRILVPESLETEWKAAANWSTYANQIVGV